MIKKQICVSIRWTELITTSLEFYCLKYFEAKNVCLFALPVVILKNRVTSKIGK